MSLFFVFDTLGIFILLAIYYKMFLLRCGLCAPLMYACKDRCLGNCLILCPFSIAIAVDSLTGPRTCLVIGSCPVNNSSNNCVLWSNPTRKYLVLS